MAINQLVSDIADIQQEIWDVNRELGNDHNGFAVSVEDEKVVVHFYTDLDSLETSKLNELKDVLGCDELHFGRTKPGPIPCKKKHALRAIWHNG